MGALKSLLRRIRLLFGRTAAERDLDAEIRLHIELETAKNAQLGMAPREARRQAMAAFGGVEVTKEAHRDGRGSRWAGEFVSDVRHAFRALRRSPVLATTAIITLALGIGANTAIFSAVHAVMLRPLPFADRGRLVSLWEENPDRGWHKNVIAPANFFDWRAQVSSFAEAAAYNPSVGNATLTGSGEPVLLKSQLVGGNFFDVLGVRARAGRTFADDETWVGAPLITVISDRLWRNQFGARADVVNSFIELSGRKVQVVGILPPGFAFPGSDADLYRPLGLNRTDLAQVQFRRAHWLRGVARLKPGVAIETANAEFQAVVRRLQRDYPVTNTNMGAGMTPLHEFLVGDTRRPLLVLLGAVAMLMLIACANVGNLLLVQAAAREREVAVRLALGARKGRLVRQALTESLVLSSVGGAAGLAIGWWGTHALVALQPAGMLPVGNIGLNWTVLAFAFGVSALSGLLFGLAPALWSGKRVAGDVLKEGGRANSSTARARRVGGVLVVAEVALALLLTVGAGLLVRSFWQLERVNPGLDTKNVLTATINLPFARYDSVSKITAFFSTIKERARALPNVRDVGAVSMLPMGGASWSSDFSVSGRAPGDFGVEILHRDADPDYFRVVSVPLLAGRFFTPDDRLGSEPVVIINDVLAKRYFRGEDPVGRRMAFDRKPDTASVWRTIVGVVGSERQEGLGAEARPEVFQPYAQRTGTVLTFVMRTAGDPAAVAPSLRALVSELDPRLAIASLQPMAAVRASALARQKFLTTLLLAFAIVGLALAVVGVYGVMAQLARARMREMGIRIALGARSGQLQWLVVRHGMLLTGAGLACGLVLAFVATRLLAALLYGVRATDPPTFVAVPLLLALAALGACWVPAWRASNADPMTTLRTE